MLVDLNTLKTVSNGFLQKINENSNDFLQKIDEKADKKEIVQSDWNQNDKNAKDYINNRTHWEEKEKKITEILPLTTLEFTSTGYGGAQSINSLSVVEGETYIVNWDGQEYPCICFSFSGLKLGNLSILGATDTGEPFLIFPSGLALSSTIGTHTITIYKEEEDITIHQLDSKYIKDMYSEKVEEIFSVENAVFGSENSDFGDYFFDQTVVITEGKTYIVNWDGIEYICEAYVADGLSIIGNTDFGGNNEPFRIMYNKVDNSTKAESSPTTHTFSIKESEIQTISPKYIKDMYYDNGTIITEVLPETIIEGFEHVWDSFYIVKNAIKITPKFGMTYVVNWDGIEYITECKSYSDGLYIGNPNYFEELSGGDFPFLISFPIMEYNSIRVESPEFSHTISITEVNHDLKQLDIKYLPIIEKTSQTMFEMNDIPSSGTFEAPTDKILIGEYLVTIDGISKTVNFEFNENNQNSSALHPLAYINSFYEDGKHAIYLYFRTSDTHSVKIEKINNFIKEENLPDSITRRPDWNQNNEAASDFIKNRPFYKEENIEELIFEGEINFDEDGCYYFDPQIELKSRTKYTIVFNGLAYEEESYFDDTDYTIMIQVNTDCGRHLYISSGTLQIYGQKINGPCYFKIFIGSLHVAKKIEPMFIQEDDRKMSALDPYGSGSFSMNIRYNAQIGSESHAEGSGCEASGDASHAEGSDTIASGNSSHAEGSGCEASEDASHAEGTHTIASGDSSHAEGLYTEARGRYSHAEGLNNFATTRSQNVTGEFNIPEGVYSSSETKVETSAYICSHPNRNNIYFCDGYTFDKNSGLYELVPIEYESVMNGYATLVLRKNVYMIYGGKTGTVMYYGDTYNTGTGSGDIILLNIGGIKYEAVNNTTIRGKYAHIVGNGASDEERSNAHTLDWNGVGWFQGGLQVGGTAQDGDGVGYVPVIPAGASVGQAIVVKAVDENGKPTEWECADIEKKTKLITIVDITAENDIILSKDDNDDLTFGDAVVSHNHFFYKTPDGKPFKAKRIYGYVYSPIAVTGTAVQLSPYYADGDPNGWSFGDFLGNGLGMGELSAGTLTIEANKYHVFEASSDMSRFGHGITGNLNWIISLNRRAAYKAIDHQFPHISGVKFSANMTLPAGVRFVVKAEVYDE